MRSNRKQFLTIFSLLCVIALSHITVSAVVKQPKRPNIIVYLSDDHGQEFTGAYGNRVVRTPNIDELAREGMRFTSVFAASPTCSPSRAVLWTGLHSARNGTMGNHTESRPGIKSLASYLKALGYRVVMANKSDVRPASVFDFEVLKADLPTDQSFRRYRGEGLDTAAVDRFLADHAKTHADQPLCLILGENSPHVVWERNRIYDPAALPVPPYMVDTPKTRAALARYYQEITTMDNRLGEVLRSLKRYGFVNDTLFIYTSDQGAEWEHSKWTLYDAGLRVPFIARWPGHIKAGATTDALISFVDVTPTFVDVAGGQPNPKLDGRSFASVLLGRASKFREDIYASHTGDGEMNKFPERGVRDERYKYILNLHPEREWTTHFTLVSGIPGSHKEVWDSWVEKAKTDPMAAALVSITMHHPAEELYDTWADPYELKNLAGDPDLKPVLEKMREKVRRWRAEIGDKSEE